MKTSTDTSSPALVAHSTRATGSGFFIIGRRGLDFYAPTDHWKARGFRFDELWAFGTPQTKPEVDLWHAIVPCICYMDETMFHEIPNAEVRHERDQMTLRPRRARAQLVVWTDLLGDFLRT